MIQTRMGIRMIAGYEAAKGLLVLVAGTGLLLLVHRDAQALAERLVTHLHLDPAKRVPRIFLQFMTEVTPGRLRWLALGAMAYALMRFAEAYGLWRGRRWAEWLGVVTARARQLHSQRAVLERLLLRPWDHSCDTRRQKPEPEPTQRDSEPAPCGARGQGHVSSKFFSNQELGDAHPEFTFDIE